jgi:hypothetical protein
MYLGNPNLPGATPVAFTPIYGDRNPQNYVQYSYSSFPPPGQPGNSSTFYRHPGFASGSAYFIDPYDGPPSFIWTDDPPNDKHWQIFHVGLDRWGHYANTGKMLLTSNTFEGVRNRAIWTFPGTMPYGVYKVYVMLPEWSSGNATNQAIYKILIGTTLQLSVKLNQDRGFNTYNKWVQLTTYNYQGGSMSLRLYDYTHEPNETKLIFADSVMLVR